MWLISFRLGYLKGNASLVTNWLPWLEPDEHSLMQFNTILKDTDLNANIWQYERAVSKALLERIPDEEASTVTTVSYLVTSQSSYSVLYLWCLFVVYTSIAWNLLWRHLVSIYRCLWLWEQDVDLLLEHRCRFSLCIFFCLLLLFEVEKLLLLGQLLFFLSLHF